MARGAPKSGDAGIVRGARCAGDALRRDSCVGNLTMCILADYGTGLAMATAKSRGRGGRESADVWCSFGRAWLRTYNQVGPARTPKGAAL